MKQTNYAMRCWLAAGVLILFNTGCLAQDTPTVRAQPPKPAPPAKALAGATPGQPAKPMPPPPPLTPPEGGGGGGGFGGWNVDEMNGQIRKATEELSKAKFGLRMADPFGEVDDADRSLVLLKDAAESAADTEEDLGVMAHILQKAAVTRDERKARSYGIYFRSPFGGAEARNLYLEGYGAIFFINVNFALNPPSDKSTEAEAKPSRDSEWEEARRELAHPGEGRSDFDLHGRTIKEASGPEYSPEEVENLQKNLAQALKNAVHIRKLKADETVTVVVTGRTSGKPGRGRTARDGGGTSDRLIVRAKKGDIEAFEKEKVSFDDFRKSLVVSRG
jgi:hypothetical protein